MTAAPDRQGHEPVPLAATGSAVNEYLPRLPLFSQVKDTTYFAGLTQVAVGVAYTAYIAITQATYFGFSLKGSWDNLDKLLHFAAIPWIGSWLVRWFDYGRHLYGRNEPETIITYALVVIFLVKVKKLKDEIPAADRFMIALHMPSPYQGRVRHRWGRHAGELRRTDTSLLQYVFLLPSMLLMQLPGLVGMSVVVFGGIAAAHRAGFHAGWLSPYAWWVPIVIGVGAGAFFGHRPANKAGYDIQKSYLKRRLAVAYAAEELLDRFHDGELSRDEARDQLTGMRDAKPSQLYPDAYRFRYDWMLRDRATAEPAHWWERPRAVLMLTVFAVMAGYGLYAKWIGIPSGHLRVW
jgi:hypothetical protein